ncbi:MAG: type I pullulanase [Candidatus Izimaplasma sp.]|nr:type I pullulanase [Candidatus Izimaplasma bacterium]
MINNDFKAYLDDTHLITVLIKKHKYNSELNIKLFLDDSEIQIVEIKTEKLFDYYKIHYVLDEDISLRKNYYLVASNGEKTELFSGKIVRTVKFINDYNYQNNDLGIIYDYNFTTFNLWSPIAKKVIVELFDKDNHQLSYDLHYKKAGVWTLTLEKNLENYKYRYRVYVNGSEKIVNDPYAISSNANGEYSYIINRSKTYQMNDSVIKNDNPIIYETSIRDFTSDDKEYFIDNKKYLGFIEKDKTVNNKPIGFDYLKYLGFTHIQFMPIFDFTGVDELKPEKAYNWGYNPSQFFIPEGSYSLEPNHPYKRINEVKQLVETLHNEHIGAIMDVVYNHVDVYKYFPYEKMVPGYSFRVDDMGLMTAHSGCKNDLATERPMIRKLIIDSLKYWLTEFDLDGFRFDLMGLIDYNTMNAIQKELTEIKPDILLYGEGWKIVGDDNLAHMENKALDKSIKFFNDQFRDLIKGSTFNKEHRGFALGNLELQKDVKKLFVNEGKLNTSQSINYVECHDNLTFFDKTSIIEKSIKTIKKQQFLATAITILAPGIPFIHSGQEFYRSKDLIDDSYNKGDNVNQISWQLVDGNWEDIKKIKSIIELRKKMNLKVKNVVDLPYGLKVDYIDYQVIFKITKHSEKINISDNMKLKLASNSIKNINNEYVLKDIGVYIFERK